MQEEINLDNMFVGSAEPLNTAIPISQSVQIDDISEAIESVSVDWDELLEDVCYKLPNGYPTIVDGKFTESDEIAIINEALEERGLPTISLMKEELITIGQLSSNPTDVKEAMVCLFVDLALTDSAVFEIYRACLDKSLDDKKRAQLLKTLKTKISAITSKFGKNYGIDGYNKMSNFIIQALSDIKKYKVDLITINNGIGAADAIVSKFSVIKPGMVARDDRFEAIRSHAVKLIESNYQIKGYYPDNWCPGDVYFFLSSKVGEALKTQRLNVGKGSLNDFFYGTTNKNGPIIAVSLKMQEAQAGKATTFIKNVVVDGISTKDKLGKDVGNQQVIKYRDLARRLEKYYINSDEWKKDEKAFEKVRGAVAQLNKMSPIKQIPTSKNQKEWLQFLSNSKNTIQKINKAVGDGLGKSVNTATTFQQAYTRFVKNLQAMNITKVEGNSKDFVKKIEDKNKINNKGKLDTVKMQGLLSQKAATYDLASILIEKWTEKTKRISPAFAEHLNKVKNPFVAITMFAIAQHGLNPNFYKAIGKNDGSKGIISEFPTNSVVDEKKSIQQLKIVDSPGQAGFYIDYVLTINNHSYKTLLVFRFSKDQIRIEVEELSAI